MCKDCSEPDLNRSYHLCCNLGSGRCEAYYTEDNIFNCIHCGAEMSKENDFLVSSYTKRNPI